MDRGDVMSAERAMLIRLLVEGKFRLPRDQDLVEAIMQSGNASHIYLVAEGDADRLLAAGFGNVAKARAEMVEECVKLRDPFGHHVLKSWQSDLIRRALAQQKEPSDVG